MEFALLAMLDTFHQAINKVSQTCSKYIGLLENLKNLKL